MCIIPSPPLVIYADSSSLIFNKNRPVIQAVIINIREGNEIKEDEMVQSRIEAWFPLEWEKGWRD